MECSVNFSSTRNGSGGKIRANASIRQGLEPIEARVSTKISATISKIVSIGFKPPAEAFSALPPYLFGSQPPDSSDIANAYLEEAIDPPADGVEAPAPRVLGQGSIPIPLTTINGMSLLSLRSLRFGQVYIDKTGISSGGTVSFYINDSLVATKTPDNNDFYFYVNINAGDILKIESTDGQFIINALSLIPSENVDFKVEFSLRQLDSIYVGEKKNSAVYGGEYFDTKFITQQDGWAKYKIAAFTSNNDDSYAFGFGPNPKVVRFGGPTEIVNGGMIDGENALSQNPPLYTNSPKSMISNKKIEGFVYPYGEGDYTSDIRSFASFATTSIKATITIRGTDTAVIADKYGGHVDKFASYKNGFPATQVFYPTEDIESVNLVDKTLTSGSLYQSVDEGTFVKTANGLINITDDYGSFIQSNKAFTQGGSYRYKFGVDNPNVTPRENFLVIRAAAPFNSIESEVSSKYKIHNIRFEDPSGDLIVKYKDIDFRGDSDYTYENEKYNFTTYITEPEINYVKFSTWHPNFPILSEPSGYTVSFDVNVDVIHDPFSSEFNKGYQHDVKRDKFVETTNSDYMANYGSPLSTMTQNLGPTPTPSFRISNIDLIASGTLLGFLTENRLLLNTEFPPTGVMLERDIYPTRVLGNNFVTGIEPEVKSVWKSSADAENNVYYNTDKYNLDNLTLPLADPQQVDGFVRLESTEPIADSGKLKLLYEHAPPFRVRKRQGGAFSFGADNIDNQFDTAKVDYVYIDDSYFDIYEIELHIRARKAFGSRDYSLDVVGYSNDDVMIETKAVGGFLQSASGVGTIPQSSGWHPVNDLGLSSESISERDHFFVTNKTNNDGGDHYLLSQSPVIDSTEFKDYIIPLKIYKDNVVQGQSPNYAVSKYFESLYVDIYPIPVGAAIAKANLVVKYHPAKTMPLHILGTGSNELTRSNITLTPSARKTNDERFNAVWTDKPLSSIEDIPHGYKAPNKEPTLKTNYSRRWRGVDGNVQVGAFNPAEFDYSFEFNQISQPFLDGYFDFNKTTNNVVTTSLDDEVNVSGEFNSDLEASKTTNLGLRFNSDKLFSTQLHNYKTIDWVTNTNHELYGHIMDAYENAVRISGSDGCFDFGDHSMSGGFNVFCRFSPDVTISGANYNLFNSGVILSKWDADKDLEFALGFDQGKLCGYARDTSDNIVKVTDTLDYYDYQYPLSVMLSYNDNNSQKLRLYADNEIVSGDFNVLRASSPAFTMSSGDSNLIVGHSYGSGVGMNAFLTDVGISTSGNITVNSYEKSKLQTTAESFFAGHRSKFWNNDESTTHDRYKMWDYVDQETDKWYLGAFKYCEFNSAFDTMKTRIGQDFIVHSFSNNNKSYEDITDLAIPESLNTSGVAYHTQVENDMLRLNVGGLWDQFYAAPPRISKSYPRSYDLKEDAFSVKTVIQNSSNTNVEWPDGNLGPRLIVSLYTKSKESVHFESTNWGLINRSIHYLAPDMCWIKLNSKFNLRDLKDKTTEPWSNFVKEQNVTELNHKYFSNDVNDLYIQYDLVYPTGNYDSTIKIHSVDVKMNQAITEAVELNSKFPLMASGDTVVRNELKLAQYNGLGFVESDTPVNPQKPFKFATLGRDPTYASGQLWLETSGANMVFADSPNELPLMTRSAEPVTSNNNTEGNFTQTPIFGASSSTFDQYGKSVVLGLDFETDLNNLSPYKMTTSSSSPLQARNASLLPNAPNLESLEIVSNAAKFGSGAIKQQCGSNSKGIFFNDGSNQIQSNTTLQNSLTLDPNIWGGDYNIDFWIYLPQFPTLSTNLSEFKSRIWSASKSIPLNVGALSETKDFKFEMDLMSTWNGTQWKHDLVLLRTLNPRYFLDITYQDSWKFPETQILKIEDISSLEWNYVSFGSFSNSTFAYGLSENVNLYLTFDNEGNASQDYSANNYRAEAGEDAYSLRTDGATPRTYITRFSTSTQGTTSLNSRSMVVKDSTQYSTADIFPGAQWPDLTLDPAIWTDSWTIDMDMLFPAIGRSASFESVLIGRVWPSMFESWMTPFRYLVDGSDNYRTPSENTVGGNGQRGVVEAGFQVIFKVENYGNSYNDVEIRVLEKVDSWPDPEKVDQDIRADGGIAGSQVWSKHRTIQASNITPIGRRFNFALSHDNGKLYIHIDGQNVFETKFNGFADLRFADPAIVFNPPASAVEADGFKTEYPPFEIYPFGTLSRNDDTAQTSYNYYVDNLAVTLGQSKIGEESPAEDFFTSLNNAGASTDFFANQGAGTTASTYWRGNDFNISFASLNGQIKSYSPDRGYWSLDDVNPSILSDHSYPALILGDHWYPEDTKYANTDISQSLKDLMFYYIDEMRVTLGAPRIEVSRSTSSVNTDTVPTATMPDPTATTTTTTSTTTPAPRGLKLAVTGGTPDIRNGDISLYLRNTELEIFESGVLPINILPGVRGLFEDISLMAEGGPEPEALDKNAQFVLYTVTPPLQDSISADFALTVKATFNTNVFDSGNMPLMSFNEAIIPEGVGATSFSFNSQSYGSFIDVADTSLLTLRPDDEIRGVTTICFGGCDYNGNCNELELITHDTTWRPAGCVNGGILRPLTTFTDPNAIAFNGDQSGGYKNNYYGVRKYTGLMPAGTYSVTLVGRTGSDGIIDVPREIVEWEYGTNEDVDYTGLKLVDETTRQIEDRYGKSVSIVGDLMTVGAPGYDLLDFSGFECVDAGTVFVYRRNPEPSGYDWTTQDDKSDWEVEATLSLSPHFRRDYYEDVPWVLKDGQGEELARFNAKKWHVGQEGREFGYSTSIAKMNDREVIAVGGPRAKFTRTFAPIATVPINLCVLIFTDEFLPKLPENCGGWRNPCRGPEVVEQYMRGKDLLYKYFADPAVEFNTKVIILEPVLGVNTVTDELNFSPEVLEATGGIVKKYRIHRHTSQYVDSDGHIKYDGFDTTTQHYKDRDALIYSEIKSAFDTEVPYDTTKPHNNVPVVLGASVDNSWSMGGVAAVGTALDKFFSFYDDYSLASGVTRFDTGTPTSGYRKLFTLEGNEETIIEDSTGANLATQTSYNAEDWLGKSIFVLGQLTNFNYININGYDKLISNNIGVYNTAAAEFNEVPASGGAVYLYEKLNTSPDWKLIQVIDSPTAENDEYPDGFGHVVKLSEDGSMLGIGSPYSKSQVGIYNRPIEYLNDGDRSVALSFANWIFGTPWVNPVMPHYVPPRKEPELVTLGVFYNEQSALVGNFEAAKDIYERVSDSGRFRFLQDQNIKPYRNFYNMDQSSTFSTNGWGWMAEKFIPTSRLGYSIAFNKDGSTVAIGAPTDSLGQHDNQSAWYQPKRSRATDWKGYVNAGAVRVLDARKYYPHKGVQEWGRFGNLHETLEKNDSNEQLFENHMRNIYNSIGKPFTRTEADGTEILDTTGLLYIITPEIDALSEQTLIKLKAWLAKGDRHLVLVGNDPIWERDGIYSQGNNILNNILFELNSRMRLHPARNEYESLNYNTVGDLHPNIVASMKPVNSLTTYIANKMEWENAFQIGQVRGSGVADIRYYNPQLNTRYTCEARKTDILTGLPSLRAMSDKAVYHEVNNKCEMPITHEGDLRAQWVDQCAVRLPTGGIAFTNYYMNISFEVGTNQFYYYRCDEQLRSRSELEPIPLMVAAEYKTKTLVSPEVPDRTELYQIVTGYETLPASSVMLNPVLTSGNKLIPDFLYVGSEEQSNYVYKNLNENNSISSNTWFDPEEYRGRDTVLQARSNVRNETQTTTKEVSHYHAAAVQSVSYDQADGSSLNSEVVLVSNTLSEKQSVLNDSDNDANILFYHNMVAMANSRGGPGKKGRVRIAQIGGWTNRTSFVAGYGGSFLSTLFSTISNASDFDIGIQENVSMDSLIDRTNAYDVAWIANTDQSPSADDLAKIKQFLSYGGKRLIVTYGPENDAQFSSAPIELDAAYIDKLDTVSQFMSDLNVDMKPTYLPNRDKYVQVGTSDMRGNEGSSASLAVPSSSYLLSPTIRHDFLEFQNYPLAHAPVDIRNGGTALLSGEPREDGSRGDVGEDIRIYDDVFSEVGFADFESGMARVKFNIPADASETEARAYKFFLTISRESPNEVRYPSIIFRNAKIQNIWSSDNVKKGDEDSYIETWKSEGLPNPLLNTRLHINTTGTGGGIKLPLKSKDIGLPSVDSHLAADREGNTIYGDQYNLANEGVPRRLESLGTGGVNTLEFDALLANDATDFEIIAHYENRGRTIEAEPEKYKTIRIVAVSGIKTDLTTLDRSRDIPVLGWAERVVPGRPEIITTYDWSGPITTSSEKYCPSDFCVEHFGNPGPNIADGPVVIAHEVYHQGGFDSGMAKSRITVISDASIIQGPEITEKGKLNITQNLTSLLRSLYPPSSAQDDNFVEFEDSDFIYDNAYKVISPEQLSPAKLIQANPTNTGLNMRFGGYSSNSLPHDSFQEFPAFTRYLSDLDPVKRRDNILTYWDVLEPIDSFGPFKERRVPPVLLPEPEYSILKQQLRQDQLDRFSSLQTAFGSTARFSGIIEGTMYTDASIYGGVPQIMQDTGYDYLDFERFPSGYPGDLFGYDVQIHNDELYISAPFTAFSGTDITTWDTVIAQTPQGPIYKTQVGHNGGAGAVYIFEKKTVNTTEIKSYALDFYKSKQWQVKQKVRPEEINVGTKITDTSVATTNLGSHSYTSEQLRDNTIVGDMFGHKMALDGDVMAISAPGHDFENVVEETKGAFVRKEFNEQFDIGTRKVHDLATLEARSKYPNSGTAVLNNGAVFTYENRISNWGSKLQEWTQIHKVVPQGSGSRVHLANENDYFGMSLALDRVRRNDASYTLVAGSHMHQYATSGSIDTSAMNQAGAIYTQDGMLRKLRPSFAHPDTFLEGRIFGSLDAKEPYSYFSIKNDGKYDQEHLFNRVVTANTEGEIFIEASGQDKIDKGYIVHRPYLWSIGGTYQHGTEVKNYQRLHIEGRPPEASGDMPLVMKAQPSLKVYNDLGISITSAYTNNSGTMPIYASGRYVDGTINSSTDRPSGLALFTNSTFSNSGDMNLYVKGKF